MQAKITEYADTTQGTEGEDAFQETEFGLIPYDWKVVRLGEIAKYVNGFAFKPTQWKDKGLPIIRIQNLTGNVDKYNYFDGKIDNRYLVQQGDLLISWSASLGVFLWKGGNAWLNQHIFKVTNLSSSVSKMFLYYVLQHYLSLITRKIRGTTMKHITKKEFIATPIPLPSLPEQEKIAKVLGTIQRAIEQQDKIIEAAKNLKKSLMQKLFTEGLGHTEFKETEIGRIPASWEVVRLGEVCEVKGGKRLPKGHKFAKAPTLYPYIRVVDFGKNSIKKDNLKFLIPQDYQLLKRYTISHENVFISIAGTTGIVGIIPEDLDGAVLTENAAKLVIKNKEILSKYFLMHFLASENGQIQVRQQTTKAVQPKLALARIKQILIPLPSLPEQKEIATSLSTVDKKIEVEERRKVALRELFKTMLHKLMIGEIRLKDVEV